MNPKTEARILEEIARARAGENPPHLAGDRTPVETRMYVDERRFALEQSRVFRRAWLPVARAAELAALGDFATVTIAGLPIAIVRGEGGALSAFHNVCLHRGAQILRAPRGHTQRLRCPYHDFTYDFSGVLTASPAEVSKEPGSRELPRIAVDTWAGWVWVNVQRDSKSLERALGSELRDELAHWDLEHVELKDRREVEGAFHWKIGVEAFLEPLHVPAIHSRTVHPIVDSAVSSMAEFDGHSRMAIPFRAAKTFEPDGPLGQAAALHGVAIFPRLNVVQRTSNLSYLVFPSTVLNFLPTHFTLYRMLPLAIDRTLVTYELYGAPALNDRQRAYYDSLEAGYVAILEEDLENLPWVHKGVASGSQTLLHLTQHERRIRHFHATLARWVADIAEQKLDV